MLHMIKKHLNITLFYILWICNFEVYSKFTYLNNEFFLTHKNLQEYIYIY